MFERSKIAKPLSIATRRSSAHTQVVAVNNDFLYQGNSILSIMDNTDSSSDDDSLTSRGAFHDESTTAGFLMGNMRNKDSRSRLRGSNNATRIEVRGGNPVRGQENHEANQNVKRGAGGKGRHSSDWLRSRIPLGTLDGNIDNNESDDELGM